MSSTNSKPDVTDFILFIMGFLWIFVISLNIFKNPFGILIGLMGFTPYSFMFIRSLRGRGGKGDGE